MTDVWRGDIVLPDGQSVRDVGFSSQHVTSSPGIPAASLRYLATVDTARIPLYLAAGPSYDVWTSSDVSEAWFESLLLSQPAPAPSTTPPNNGTTHEWWTLARAQSPIGILVQVESQAEGVHKPGVTEILLYGTIAATPAVQGLPTPPSSQDVPNKRPGLLPELRVHALPLSSDLLHNHAAASIPPRPSPSPTLNTADPPDEVEAHFLSLLPNTPIAPNSPKRKRDLFEEATLAKRNARVKGGEGVAAAAAARTTELQRPYAHRKSISFDAKVSPLPDSRPPSAQSALPRPSSRQLSRSPSITSDIRPLSRKGKDAVETQGRRSNLSRVDTVSIQPDEPTTESRNKEALTKVVMAAMRMHGLQQRKRAKSRRTSMAPGPDESQPPADEFTAEDMIKDEEFKLIYHQTYKGAALALRKHMAEKPLHTQPDRMRDLVEQFLTLFLTDPLAPPLPSHESANPVATPGVKQVGIFGSSHHHASPFDLPSGMRRPPMMRSQTDGNVYTGSPVSKRKTNDRMLDHV
ncbi:hypothetical protein N0V95_006621 [Ascochyta clinopodiicola]|nr:hypothetical protein N0V95_006621 [Ascochyta clinopodiicola]